jgi:DNA modification methylase
VARIRTGRRFIGIEIDPVHFETARDRLTRELEQGRFNFSTPEPAPAIRQADML